MKKLLVYISVAVLCVFVLSISCSGATVSPTTPASVPAKSNKVIELTFNNHAGAVTNVGKAWDAWAKWVGEQSGGRLKINMQHGGGLLTGAEVFRGVQTKVAAGGQYIIDKQDGFLLSTVISLPFMGLPEGEKSAKLYMDIINKYPEMKAEWKGITILSVQMMPPAQLHTKNNAIKTPGDIKGKKIIGIEAVILETIAAVGGVPVQVDVADMASSLNQGLAEGLKQHFPAVKAFGALDLLKYHTIFGNGGINMTPKIVIMNTEVLNSLPADLQKLLIESGEVWAKTQIDYERPVLEDIKNATKSDTYSNLTPEEIKAWYNLVKKPVHDKWIAECAAKGQPGQAVYDETLKLIQSAK